MVDPDAVRELFRRRELKAKQRDFERKQEERLLEESKEQEERLLEESKEWLETKELSGINYMTLWGAAKRLSSIAETDVEKSHDDSFSLRLPEIIDAVNNGALMAINSETSQLRREKAVYSDVVIEDDFNDWFKGSYPHLAALVSKVHSSQYSVREEETVLKLITALRKLNFIKGNFIHKDVDLAKYLEELLITKYQRKPQISKLRRDMELKGLDPISESAIRNAFSKLRI